MPLSVRTPEPVRSRPLVERFEPEELPPEGTFPPTDARQFLRRRPEPVADATFSGAVFMALCSAGLLAVFAMALVALGLGALSGALV